MPMSKRLDLNNLSPAALAAAMRGGTETWGQWGSSEKHTRYAQPIDTKSRRRCWCGCKRRATHVGMANGVALTSACELGITRWVKTGKVRPWVLKQ